MFSFYIIFTINTHLIEQNVFNTKLQVVNLVLKHRDSKKWNLHKHFVRIYLVFSIGFASKYIITKGRNSEYDQEIPQSQTANNPWHREQELLNHHKTPGRQIKQSNQLSLPHQEDCLICFLTACFK